MRRRFAAALLLAAGATPAAAQNFTCANKGAEIRCDGGTCKVEAEAFTPMSLSRQGSRVSICAYSGCWEGPILVRRSRGTIDLLYAEVRNDQADSSRGMNELAIVYDRSSRTAQMRWGGFANAMDCGARD